MNLLHSISIYEPHMVIHHVAEHQTVQSNMIQNYFSFSAIPPADPTLLSCPMSNNLEFLLWSLFSLLLKLDYFADKTP